MSLTIRTLIVEDDPATLQQWKMEFELRNSEEEQTGIRFDVKTAKSLDEVKALILDHDFDVAIVDINLKSTGYIATNKDGNLVLQLILDSELAVVAVFSGEPSGSAAPPEWADDVRIFAKGDGGLKNVMDWLLGQVPMLRQIKLANRQIKKEMVKLFTRSIWPRWNQWIKDIPAFETSHVGDALTRHLTAHMYGTFLEKSEHKVHPEEWYFIPSIRDGLRTGDLIKRADGVVEILVTPRCDLARAGKNESLQLAECRDVSVEWNSAMEKIKAAEQALADYDEDDTNIRESLKKKVDTLRTQFRQFSQHKGNSSVFHFLPRVSLKDGSALGPFLINFDKIRSVPRSDQKLVRILDEGKFAAITPEFLPSIIERLGAYFSRFGNPDYSHPD
jgi:hypothetical protein